MMSRPHSAFFRVRQRQQSIGPQRHGVDEERHPQHDPSWTESAVPTVVDEDEGDEQNRRQDGVSQEREERRERLIEQRWSAPPLVGVWPSPLGYACFSSGLASTPASLRCCSVIGAGAAVSGS